ncbi:thiol-disulfide oxidoreductase DCC family protein [Shewanella waksmanii]|uniref:thiol-disulfide oxidoreductase DCC family protein n=1 Tax=Shewanella waksmanii TaxID=213783 RepID=UPI003735047E
MKLTIFYDGQCPLCSAEMKQLKQHDDYDAIALEDLNQAGFAEKFPEIDPVRANVILHGKDDKGQVLLGLDVTYLAWMLVGKKYRVAFLRWPVVKPVADMFYLAFAKHRYTISYLLTGKKRCDSDSCSL